MRFYVNSKYELVCAPDYHDKFGTVTGNSILINTGTFTNVLEEKITLAVEEILKQYQHTVPKELIDELFAEQKRQIKQSYDISATLTEYIDNENSCD